ncbi:MAG TPA: hypothetical protein VGP62_30005 [Bryobacteraceae bacterium]|jgi:hypothetical protein|nr:hypothetical protein [Bryobacteraceae bacterium]
MATRFVVFGLALALSVGAMADPTFQVLSGGTLTATVADAIAPPGLFLGLDLRGSSNAAVFDPVLIGAGNVSNIFPFSFPSTTLFAQNFAATQFVSLTEESFSLVGTELLVNELGTPLTAVTDPGLQAFQGQLLFDFTYQTTVVDTPDNVVASYFLLSNITAVPEPSGLPMVLAGGFLMICYLSARRWLTRRGTGQVASSPCVFES